MEMVPTLPIGRRAIRGTFSHIWDEIFKPENVNAKRVWKLTIADCKGKTLHRLAVAAQSAGRTRNLRVTTRRAPDALFLQVSVDVATRFQEESL